MAKGMYYSGRSGFAGGDVDWINSPISALLVDLNHYSPDLYNDATLADIPEAARIAEVTLTGKSITPVEIAPDDWRAILRADTATFNSVPADPAVEISALVIFKNERSESETRLLFFNDEAPEFPVVPDGTDQVVYWDPVDGIFRI